MSGLSARYLYKGLTAAKELISVSQFSANELRRFYKILADHVTVIPNGVGEPFTYQPAIKKESLPTILFVGSHHPRKNAGVAEQVLANIKNQYPQATLVKVGTGQNMSESELAQQYNQADALIFPSTFEGFGLPVLQAMACGLPVVASNSTSIPEVAGDAALLCDPHDEAALTAAVLHILEDPALREDLRKRGLKQAQKFRWPTSAQATVAVYHKVAR